MPADDVRNLVIAGVALRLILPRALTAPTIAHLRASTVLDRPTAPGPAPWTIVAVVDPAAIARAVHADADAIVEPVPGVRLSQRTSEGSTAYTVTGDDIENLPGAWSLSVTGRDLLLTTALPDVAPRYILRIVREIVIRSAENHGATLFHAAGLSVNGHAVLVVGPPAAGKTTLLACLLHAADGRAELLSNDRILVDGHRATAVPLPVPLARGTLDAFPRLRLVVPETDRLALEDAFATRHKTTVTAAAYAAAFGSGLTGTAPLALVIAPALSADDQSTSTRPLDAPEAEHLLSQACYTPHDEFWRPWFIPREQSDDDLHERSKVHCVRLARDVPAVAIAHGVRSDLPQLIAAARGTIAGLL